MNAWRERPWTQDEDAHLTMELLQSPWDALDAAVRKTANRLHREIAVCERRARWLAFYAPRRTA